MNTLDKRMKEKIKIKTRLSDHDLSFYKIITDSILLNSNVVRYQKVIWEIQNKLYKHSGGEFKTHRKKAEQLYNIKIKRFENKRLIDYLPSKTGRDFPRFVGYNYYNDKEFFLAIKNKNSNSWNERIQTSKINQLELIKLINNNYEIESNSLMGILLN